jgi:hypothetical protein
VSIRQVPAATARSGTQRARQTSSSQSQFSARRASIATWLACGSVSGVVCRRSLLPPVIVTQLATRS